MPSDQADAQHLAHEQLADAENVFYESEEEDIESDADEQVEFSPSKRVAQFKWYRRQLYEIKEQLDNGSFDLNPPYQRGTVWTPPRQSKFIASIMQGFYVPPLIINTVSTKRTINGEEKELKIHRVVDGKQRLTAINEFLNGNVPHVDENKKKFYLCDNGDGRKKKLLLPAKYKRLFLRCDLLATQYHDLSERMEEDLFQRVQMGVTLTVAEKMKATDGPWQRLATQFETKYASLMQLFDNQRGRAHQLILQIFKQIHQDVIEDPNPAYKAGATGITAFCTKFTPTTALLTNATQVFTRYDEIRRLHPHTFENQSYKHAKKFSPVEFVAVAILINHNQDRNATLLSGDILALRQHLRERYVDLRNNGNLWAAIVAFIDNIELYRGGVGVRTREVRGTGAGVRDLLKSAPVAAMADRSKESGFRAINALTAGAERSQAAKKRTFAQIAAGLGRDAARASKKVRTSTSD